MSDEFLRLRDVAQALGLSYERVRAMCADDHPDHIPHIGVTAKNGSIIRRFPRAEFEEWREGHRL